MQLVPAPRPSPPAPTHASAIRWWSLSTAGRSAATSFR